MDKLKNLLVNGCSFLNHRHTDEIDLYLSPAELVKAHGGFEHMDNFARGGRGNDRIHSTTITHFEMFPERKKDTFVLIGWSSALRMDYPTRKDFKPMPPYDETWGTIKMATGMSVYAFVGLCANVVSSSRCSRWCLCVGVCFRSLRDSGRSGSS